MPFDHTNNSANGNALKKVADEKPTVALQGRTTKLPIPTVKYASVKGMKKDFNGASIDTVITAIKAKDAKAQRSDHADELGNLPVAPGGGVTYEEYHVESSGFTKPGYVRLVADRKNKRLYITPTHYDVWVENAKGKDAAKAIDPKGDAKNPFFLLTGVGGDFG